MERIPTIDAQHVDASFSGFFIVAGDSGESGIFLVEDTGSGSLECVVSGDVRLGDVTGTIQGPLKMN
jgi:hypothetical protein